MIGDQCSAGLHY